METIDLIIRNIKLLMLAREIKNPTRLAALMEEVGYPYSQPNLSRLLSREYNKIDLDSLIKLSRFFNVTVGQILGEEPLQTAIHLPVEDEFKRQLCMLYDRLTSQNKDALTVHANLLLTAQGINDAKIDPFPVAPAKSQNKVEN